MFKQVVIQMQDLIREDIDWVAGYGGEEFLLVLPLTDIAGSLIVADRLKRSIAEIFFTFSRKNVHLTVSFGVSGINDWQDHGQVSHETLLNSADVSLYRAKERGRNKVVSGPPIFDAI